MNNNKIKAMPDGMRIAIAILFFFISVFFAVSIIDTVLTDYYISTGGVEIDANVINKKTTHNKYGYRYYVSYVFSNKGKEYKRRSLFGLFSKDTEITKNEYDRLETGSVMPILYYGNNPSFNSPKNISITSNKNMWFFLGIIVFGVISLNEFRCFIKRKFLKT